MIKRRSGPALLTTHTSGQPAPSRDALAEFFAHGETMQILLREAHKKRGTHSAIHSQFTVVCILLEGSAGSTGECDNTRDTRTTKVDPVSTYCDYCFWLGWELRSA